MADFDLRYAFNLPPEEVVGSRLRQQARYWRDRNDLIARIRDALSGQNKIPAPTAAQYKVRVSHTYLLLAAANEKAARFMARPRIAVVPDSISAAARARSSKMERAINRIFEEMEIQSDGDVWSRVIFDAITLDSGFERIERAPAACWPELTIKEDGHDSFSRIFEDPKAYKRAKENYKKRMPIPFRTVYCPAENVFPVYEGATMVECFEVERRSIRSILANPLFDVSRLSHFDLKDDGGLSTQVTLLHYCNQNYHAYYVLAPANDEYRHNAAVWPRENESSVPILLYAYEHGLGQTLYNHVGGRYGGWKGSYNRGIGIMEALLELNQDADEVASQYLTWIRSQGWPQYVAYFDPENRTNDGTPPKPPVIQEGGTHALWNTEKIDMLPMGRMGPEAKEFYTIIRERIAELAGASSLYGIRQPGIETGYHESLAITQSEHLDAKLEQHFSRGAINRALLILKHIIAMDEEVFVAATAKKNGTKYSEWLSISPADLEQMPHLDAKVREHRPTDFMAAVQTAIQATSNRRGPGTPLLSDDTTREMILDVEEPDEELRKIILEMEQQRLLQSDVIHSKIVEALNLALVKQGVPQISEDAAKEADPALMQAIQSLQGESAGLGGIDPRAQEAMMKASMDNNPAGADFARPRMGTGGGLAPGMPQPAQTLGRGQQLLQGGP